MTTFDTTSKHFVPELTKRTNSRAKIAGYGDGTMVISHGFSDTQRAIFKTSDKNKIAMVAIGYEIARLEAKGIIVAWEDSSYIVTYVGNNGAPIFSTDTTEIAIRVALQYEAWLGANNKTPETNIGA